MSRKILWIDGSSGASGDMVLGMLVDLGLPVDDLRRALETLPIDGWSLTERRVERSGVAACKIDVHVPADAHGRGWKQIRDIVESARLDLPVKQSALAVFRRLIDAEARAHGRAFEEIHLHEAGGIDAIVDVVGACVGFHALGVERIVVSRLTTGFGTVRCAHGVYPVPGPATLNLVRGIPVEAGSIEAERLTPTGAAILTTLADAWGTMPALEVETNGYGSGCADFGETPNVLRGVLGREDLEIDAQTTRSVVVIETNLDDATPQALAFTIERLLDDGALDAMISPALMKKGRPGHLLTILARPADADRLGRIVLAETPALGLRFRREHRVELERRFETVSTPFGTIRLKVGTLEGETLNVWPEYEDCAAAARNHGVPFVQVQQAALSAARQGVIPDGRNETGSGAAEGRTEETQL
ncbi:MAG: nickel pincer cofactor biosynthesis protein LarC [Acidobacteria bacterium]|nr:nickel pincer cofactor biosynthesis protein LarC [Acidobacteriota bacterium]NIM60484.1 nickel pincer cofactor biosynthesis protein LarC [Acidobacteriota bacterium]NIO60381.1 nickel pincer cofactor biosynthesis protein LarC [Acidobacteriota bacterium]NIQ31453.1 nickel pincer cofactor biosynthesis protein LarC [Acidobacteriota bacterium]NIQ86697.1 nickel pincer cofactor biosynthesis protein LarC [Acidobacteriota bacterium]